MAYTTLDWYDAPRYYDIVFDTDTREEFAFVQAVWQRLGRSSGRRVLEPACGTGRLLARFARAGAEVAGFDASEAMIDFAQRRFHRAKLMGDLSVARMEAFKYRHKFDLAFNLVSTFKYLLTEDDAAAHLRCIARALRVGGIYVLGFHLTDYTNRRKQRERWVGVRGGTRVVCNIQGWPADARTRTEQVRSRLSIHERGQDKRFETSWTFRTYCAEQFRRLLSRVPQLELVATYDFNYDIEDPKNFGEGGEDQIVVLRRRRGG